MAKAEVMGLVLAGGRSRRLGQDKVVLPYAGGCLLSRSVDLLQKFCPDVWVSGRNPAALSDAGQHPDINAPWLPDDIPGIGPMGGIITCLKRLQRPLLVIACDLPLLDEDTIRWLLEVRTARKTNHVMTTFLQLATGFIESLVAVYEPEALPYLEASYEKGMYKLSRALPPEVRLEIPYSPEKGHVFFNINHPEDLQKLRSLKTADCAKNIVENICD